MLSGVAWYVAARFVAVGVFLMAASVVWRDARMSPPSHRRRLDVVAVVLLVVAAGTLLVDVLTPGIQADRQHAPIVAIRFVALGVFLTLDINLWWMALVRPPSRTPAMRVGMVAVALVGLAPVALTLFSIITQP